ncbi:MAG TPA: TSUP family transporter [Burkholderiales bacterium]|nr:TSUP family transporter [Burkholderiales bacterium]
MDLAFLGAAAFVAGLLDAVVGGGGLVQIPALFSVMPNGAPATVFGTNKLSSIFGTGIAGLRYARAISMRWNAVLPAMATALVFAYIGAYSVAQIPSHVLRPLVPFMLIAVAVYIFVKKDFGAVHAPRHEGLREKILGLTLGGVIGFYDGFFGPGTGSFLMFLFIRFFGLDFLSASAAAKFVNVACNAAALAYFWPGGHVIWQLGLTMAVCNVLGSLIGSRLALRYGSQFVRRLFLLVVSAMILKLSYDLFLK